MALHHWFIPHKETHKKAHFLSLEAFAAYIFLFLALQFSFHVINLVKPGVLGITSSIEKQDVIRLTNIERQKLGLPTVVENQVLDKAAEAKAQNMFAENYWAHFSPSGKDPWSFILGAGYKFSFAGENLAKNFSDSQSVVTAWMNSPSHRENVVNGKYKDIGVAVLDGTLNGQNTTLVVQMFGTTENLANLPSSPPTVNVGGTNHTLSVSQLEGIKPLATSLGTEQQSSQKVLVNQYMVSKSFGLALISLVLVLLLVDFIVLKRRGVFRIASHHLAHMVVLGVAAATLLTANPGSIL